MLRNGASQLQIFIYQSSTTIIKGYYDDIELFEMAPDELKLYFEYGAPTNTQFDYNRYI